MTPWRWLALAISIYLAAVGEVALTDAWAIGQVVPDLFVVACTISWTVASLQPSWLVALVVGMAADLNRGGAMGVTVVALLLLAAVLDVLPAHRWRHQPLAACIVATVATVVVHGTGAWAGTVGIVTAEPCTPLACLAAGAFTAAVTLPCAMLAGWIVQPSDAYEPAAARG